MESFKAFISYRRADTAGHARSLYRELGRRLNAAAIFFDRASIESGDVFPDTLREAIEQSEVVLVLIAPGWLGARDESGERRLDHPHDFVRREVELALRLGRQVIPILFDGAPMPTASELPTELTALTAAHAHHLRGQDDEYEGQLERLVEKLARIPGLKAGATRDDEVAAVVERHRGTYLADYAWVSILGDHPADVGTEAPDLAYAARTMIQVTGMEGLRRRRKGEESPEDNLPPPERRESFFLDQLRQQGACLLVEGEGGSGKTEFARRLAFGLAQRLAPGDPRPPDVPVLVQARALTDASELRGPRALLAALVERAGVLAEAAGTESVFEHLLRAGRLVLILDGLDELRDPSMLTDLDRALAEARRSGLGNCGLVVTARPSALARTPMLRRTAGAARFRLLPLGPAEVTAYVDGFFEDDTELREELKRALRGTNESVARLLRWPLFLTLTCTYWRAGTQGMPFSSPAELMRQALEHLLIRRLPSAVSGALDDLGHLAWEACPTFGRLAHEVAAQAIVEEALERCARDTGILRGTAADGYTFAIRPLAEYLAGRRLAQRQEADVLETYGRHGWSTAWRQPLYWCLGELWRTGRSELAGHILGGLLDEIDAGRDDVPRTLFVRLCEGIGSGGEDTRLDPSTVERVCSLLVPEDGVDDLPLLVDLDGLIGTWSDGVRDQFADEVVARATELGPFRVAPALRVLRSQRGLPTLLAYLAGEGYADLEEEDVEALAQYVIPALGTVGSEEAARAIERFVEGDNEILRGRAVAALAAIGSPDAIPLIERRLGEEKDEEVRGELYSALAELGSETAVPRLVEEIEAQRADPKMVFHPKLFFTLEEIAASSDSAAIRALQSYRQRTEGQDLYFSHRAAVALGGEGRPTVLLPLQVHDEDMELAYTFFAESDHVGQQVAVTVAGPGEDIPIGTVLAASVRVPVLSDDGAASSYHLVRFDEPDPERGLDSLRTLLAMLSDAEAKANVVQAMAACGLQRAEELAVASLREDPRPSILYAAVHTLEKIGTRAVVPALREWLDPERSPENDLSWHVGHALLQLDATDPALVAACIDYEFEEIVAEFLGDHDWTAFCLPTADVEARFGGLEVQTRQLQSDPRMSAVVVARDALAIETSLRRAGG